MFMNNLKGNNESEDQYSSSEICSEDYLKCALCGQDLQFTHQTDYLSLSVKEDARCACCNVKLKSRSYILQ